MRSIFIRADCQNIREASGRKETILTRCVEKLKLLAEYYLNDISAYTNEIEVVKNITDSYSIERGYINKNIK